MTIPFDPTTAYDLEILPTFPIGAFAVPTGGQKRTIYDRLGDQANVLDYYQPTDPDMAAGFRRALATNKLVIAPFLSNGYTINSQVDIDIGQFIEFQSNQIINSTSPTSVFRFIGGWTGTGHSGIKGRPIIDMIGAPSGSSAMRFGTSLNNVGLIDIVGISARNCYAVLDQETHASHFVYDVALRDLRSVRPRGTQFSLTRTQGFIEVDVRVDNTQQSASYVTWPSVFFSNFAGLTIDRIDVVGGPALLTPAYQSTGIGLLMQNTSGAVGSVYLRGYILVDSTMGPGIYLQNVDNWRGRGAVQSFGNLGTQVTLIGCSRMDLNLSATGQRGNAAALNAVNINIDTCSRLTGAVQSDNAVSSGVYLHNSSNCSLVIDSVTAANYGLVEDGTSDRNVYTGTMQGTVGSLSITGAQSRAVNFIPNDSAFHAGPTNGVVA